MTRLGEFLGEYGEPWRGLPKLPPSSSLHILLSAHRKKSLRSGNALGMIAALEVSVCRVQYSRAVQSLAVSSEKLRAATRVVNRTVSAGTCRGRQQCLQLELKGAMSTFGSVIRTMVSPSLLVLASSAMSFSVR